VDDPARRDLPARDRRARRPPPGPDALQAWCAGRGVAEAIVGGFFVRATDITAGRYPRAALGIGRRGRLLAVAADGRGADDAGLTLAELAEALVALGATRAINLDGGGSASLVGGGALRNRPREGDGAPIPGGRPVTTALVFTAR
jgi:Phosphodiester glycosidase